jgi:hypothetical protein
VLAVRRRIILRMVTIPGSLPHNHNFLKFIHKNIIKMKNKPDPALLQPSNLSNEIEKRVPKSREIIPLRDRVASSSIYCKISMGVPENYFGTQGVKNCEI